MQNSSQIDTKLHESRMIHCAIESSNEVWKNIPEDILYYILMKCGIQNLPSVASVCKNWKNITNNQRFLNKFHQAKLQTIKLSLVNSDIAFRKKIEDIQEEREISQIKTEQEIEIYELEEKVEEIRKQVYNQQNHGRAKRRAKQKKCTLV